MSDLCTCPTCGYNWVKGQSGSHYCSDLLLKRIEELEAAIKPFVEAKVYNPNKSQTKTSYRTFNVKQEDIDKLNDVYEGR